MRFLLTGLLTLPLAVAALASTVVFNPDSKQPVKLRRGDNLVLKLNAVSDGGYSWFYELKSAGRIQLVRQGVAPQPKPKPGQPPMVGMPTVQVFTFKAVKTGNDKFGMAYGRPWEMKSGIKPSQLLMVRVKIR